MSVRKALGWSAVWVAFGLAFAIVVCFGYEHHWLGLGAIADAVDGERSKT